MTEYTIGVDVSTKRIALADNTGRCGSILIGELDRGSERLADISHRTEVYARQFANGNLPTVVWVEQPAGRFVHPNLWQAFGVVRAAMWQAFSKEAPWPVTVLTLTPPDWKLRTVGKGSATKEMVMAWCMSQGLEPSNQDEADALAIAYAGHSMLRTEAA